MATLEYIPMDARPMSLITNVKKEWLLVWERMDALNEGRVKVEDLRKAILQTKYADELPAEVITSLLSYADMNHDGYIDKEEFLNIAIYTRRSPKLQNAVRQAAFLIVPRSARDLEVRTYLDEFTCYPPPLFMIIITLFEVGVFTGYAIAMDEPVTASGPCPLYSPLIYNPRRRYEAWRYLTYMLIHSGYVHLLNNIIMQLILGIVLELVHKWWRVMLVYLVGVIAGALATSVTNPDSYLAGASGGVYAIEYAYFGNLILNWSEMDYPIPQVVVLGLFSTGDVAYALYDTYFSEIKSNTGYMAHLGGALAGVLVGVNVLRNLKKEPWERYCWWIAFVILLVLLGSAIIVNAAATSYFPPADFSPI